MPKVRVEGTTLTLDASVCATNKSLIDALVPFYPAVANAEIKRDSKTGDITVTKKAGKKGSYAPVIQALDAAPETISPILVLAATKPKRVRGEKLDQALLQAIDDEDATVRVRRALDSAEGEPANRLPIGF